MRKVKTSVFYGLLCAAMVLSAGCSLPDKIGSMTKKEKKNNDYVTLGEYKSISLKKSDVEADMQKQIDQTLDTYATYKTIKKGKVKDGDTVNIFYVGRMNGKKFDGGSCTKKESPSGFDLTIGSGRFIPGFEDQLVGKKIGDTVEVKLTFPDPYTNNPDYSGKKAVFTVTINSIRGKKVLPKLDDEFVKENLTTYDSVDDYKTTLRDYSLEELAWDSVYKASEINDYPQDRIDEMYNQLYTSITYYLSQNNYTLSDYLSAEKTTSEDFKAQLRDTAKNDVGKQLIYGAIAEKENLEISEEEYQKELKSYLTNYNCEDEEALDKVFQNYYGTNAKSVIMDDMLYKRVREFLAGNVKETD